MNLNERQIGLARHALGLPNKKRRSYRNHFVAGPGHDDYKDWMDMVGAGAATRFIGNAITGGDHLFRLTTSGAFAALKKGEDLDRDDFPS